MGTHEEKTPASPEQPVIPDDQWEQQRLEAEEHALRLRKEELEAAKAEGRALPAEWQKLMQDRVALDREKMELWQRRATMEQRSERILAHRGIKRLASTSLRAFQNHRLVNVTHRDEQGTYYFKSMSGALHAVHGKTVRQEDVPEEWLEAAAPIELPDESSDISEMDVTIKPPNDHGDARWGIGAGAALLLLIGILMLYL